MIACSNFKGPDEPGCHFFLHAHEIRVGEKCPDGCGGRLIEVSPENDHWLAHRFGLLPVETQLKVMRGELSAKEALQPLTTFEWLWRKRYGHVDESLINVAAPVSPETGEREWSAEGLKKIAEEMQVRVGVAMHEARSSCGGCMERARARGATIFERGE